jgi:hypothetical protein
MSTTKPTIKKPTSQKVEDKKQRIKVANTEIVIGETYEIIPKKDMDAPSGFQQFNTTKLLIEGIGEIRGIVFDETIRRWDTGFEVGSPCNKSLNFLGKDAQIKVYNDLIAKPYEEYFRIETDAINDEFWISYNYKLFTGRQFDTKNPADLFDLFHALKQGKICEVGEKDATLQRSANYCIRSREKVITLQEERANDKAEAIFTFMTLLDALNDKDDTLYTILEWMPLSNIRGAEKDVLKRTMLKLFEDAKLGYDNARRFLDAYEMTKSPTGMKEMELFSMLQKLSIKQKLEYKRQQYYLDGTLLGNTIKGSAKAAISNPEIRQLVVTAYENYVMN